MNKREIDAMMRDLPSQRGWQDEPLIDKVIVGLAFICMVAILIFI